MSSTRTLTHSLLAGALLASVSASAFAITPSFQFVMDRLDNRSGNTLGITEGVVHYIGAGVTPNSGFGTQVSIEQNGIELPMNWWSSHVSPNEYYSILPTNIGTSDPWTIIANNAGDISMALTRGTAGAQVLDFAQNVQFDTTSSMLSWELPSTGPAIEGVRVLVWDRTLGLLNDPDAPDLAALSPYLPPMTSYQLSPTLFENGKSAADYTVEVRLMDFRDPQFGMNGSNILSTSRYFYDLAAPVPEPETWAMMLAGLGLIAQLARRKSR